MADKQTAPHPAVEPIPALSGSVTEAQEAILSLLEPEEEKPQEEETEPTEVEESQPEEEDESFEEESEEEEEAEEVEEAEEESEDEDEETEISADDTILYDGEEYKVDDLIKGSLRQADYTRKTQALAEERKGFESLMNQYNSEISSVQQERQQYVNALGQIIQSSMGNISKFQDIDWDSLKEEDHMEYLSKKDELREAQDKIRQHRDELSRTEQVQKQQEAQQYKQMLIKEHQSMAEKYPDWADAEKRQVIGSKLQSYALSEGYSPEEVASLYDHRALLILDKARKYDEVQKANPKAKKLKNKPKVVRSGTGTTKKDSNRAQRKTQMKRLQQTGHVDDAVSLFEDFVEL